MHPTLALIVLVAAAALGVRADGPAAADRAFAARAAEVGTNAAFLEVLASDGVLFRSGPVEGRAWMLANPDDGFLAWEPRVEVLSAAGDMGFTLGPYTYSREGRVLGAGHFLSVWRRVDDGWRLTADIGVSHSAPDEAIDYASIAPATGKAPPTLEPAAAEALLRKAEADLAAAQSEAGAPALLDCGDEGLMLMRPGVKPTLGAQACEALLEHAPVEGRATLERVVVARSGDLAATWGALAAASGSGASGGWLRVWRRGADGAWRVVADVRLPGS